MKKWVQAGGLLGAAVWCMTVICGCLSNPREYSSSMKVQQGSYGSESALVTEERIQRISEGNFAYEALSDEGKTVYDQMLTAILSYEKSVNLATMDTELMREAYQALNCDYGGLFWVEGYVFTSYTRGGKRIGLEFSPNYVMEEQEKNRLQNQVDDVVDEWLGGISLRDSDYEKAKYVFETLIEQVDYVEGAKDNQNILSVFLHRETVCQGYACATQYLLRQLGISSTIISGKANNQAHAWNLVKLDDGYYHMDTTWGNSTYMDTSHNASKFVNYNFLSMTDEEISNTHRAQMPFALPKCSNMENNYYVKEGRYFETWDPEAIGAVFRTAWENGAASVAVKCKDYELYGKMKEYFVTQQKITEYCPGMEYMYYMESPEYCVFTVNFNEL